MKKSIIKICLISYFLISPIKVKADFGDADFPIDLFKNSPKSYHDAWCRKIKNECRIRFQGKAMWVEGKGGIQLSQYVGYRYAFEGNLIWGGDENGEFYNYITYISKTGIKKEALFLFAKREAQANFTKAFIRWKSQNPSPVPNYKFPNSQGPQDTQGRDKNLNPYNNEPILDFMKKTTSESKGKIGNINCDSPVWKNKPRCN